MTLETPSSSVETSSAGSATSHAQSFEGFTPEDQEVLKNLDAQLNPGLETPTSLEISPEDQARLNEGLENAQTDIQQRLERYQETHPGVQLEEVSLGDVYSDEEIAVMQQETEKLKESGVDWGYVWKGAKIVGGVLLVIGIGALAIQGLSMAGYGPAMGEVVNKMIELGSRGLDTIAKGLNYAKEGLTAALENIQSWEIWSKFNDWFSGGAAEKIREGVQGAAGSGGFQNIPGNPLGPDGLPLPPGN